MESDLSSPEGCAVWLVSLMGHHGRALLFASSMAKVQGVTNNHGWRAVSYDYQEYWQTVAAILTKRSTTLQGYER